MGHIKRTRRTVGILALAGASVIGVSPAYASAFDLDITIDDPGGYTPNQLDILTDAVAEAQALWEGLITGYEPGITIPSVPITIRRTSSGLASANFSSTTTQGGFRLATSGQINLNANEIETFASWPREDAGFGLNFIDDLIAHEIGHVLGIGTLWTSNGVYVNNSFQYTGEHGLAAYRAEFDPDAAFIPVESGGGAGSANSHWNQRFRSDPVEGDPSDPFALTPETGLLDPLGRDLAFELLTGALDPDFGEPFLSNFTVQSLRDLGYTVTTVPEPGTAALLAGAVALISTRRRRVA